MTPAERKAAEDVFKANAGTMKDRAEEFVASEKGKPAQREAVAAALPYITNKKVSVRTAATKRVNLMKEAAVHPEYDEQFAGAGWYFDHHRAIDESASTHGFDTNAAITASAVMSPQNSPENEKAAVDAIMDAHTNGVVHMAPHVHNYLVSQGVPLDRHLVNQTVRIADLPTNALAALSSADFRDQVNTNVRLKDIARGGTKGNIATAYDVLRGDKSEAEAINPHTSPKVHSYRDAIRDAVPDTDVHHEYMMRASHIADSLAGRVAPEQMMFDFYGKRDSTEGLLDPKRSTAEDTWMNSISHGQPNIVVEGTTTNVMKTAGSLLGYPTKKRTEDGRTAFDHAAIKPVAVQHALNNAATIEAAARVSKDMEFDAPSTLAQEVPWTVARREGGKDPAHNAAQRARGTGRRNLGKQFNQMELF